jgi:hypothetical protein
MFRILGISAALCAFAGAATAELTYANAFAGYNLLDSDVFDEAEIKTFGGAMEVEALDWVFSAQYERFHVSGGNRNFGSLGAGYQLRNDVTLGIDYADFEAVGLSASVTSGYALYDAPYHMLGASIGTSSDLDDPVYSLFGSVVVSRGGSVGMDVVWVDDDTLYAAFADYDLERYKIKADLLASDEADLLSVTGVYDLGGGFSATGSLSTFDSSIGDGKAYSIGARYALSPDAHASMALGRIEYDGAAKIDRISAGLEYEIGGKTSGRRSLATILSDTTRVLYGLENF